MKQVNHQIWHDSFSDPGVYLTVALVLGDRKDSLAVNSLSRGVSIDWHSFMVQHSAHHWFHACGVDGVQEAF